MKNFPTTITAENFNDAAKFVSNTLAKSRQKRLVKSLVKPIGGILFLFLSVLLVYGATLKYSNQEDMLVFIKLEPITNLWNDFSGLFTNADMEWYIFWPILIVAAFVIPLIVSAIITIIVSICYKAKPITIDGSSESEKAKALHQSATQIKDKSKDSDYYETGFTIAFILLLLAFVAFAFITLDMLSKPEAIVGMAVGVIISGFIAFWLYSLIFTLFAAFNEKFYYLRYYDNITNVTDAYWLSVDPEEVARREEEKERLAKQAAENRAKGAEKRIAGLAAERNGNYSTAKKLFLEAAYLGDALGMDNYARHCLINGKRDDAIYWLQKSIDTGEADATSRELLNALKSGQHIDVHYN